MGTWVQYKDAPPSLIQEWTLVECDSTLEWIGLHTWLKENTEEDFTIVSGYRIKFESEKDAMFFTLKYGKKL